MLTLAIAMEALSGGIKGLEQKGPNHMAAAAGAGFQQGQQQAQQVQQDNQKNEDQSKSDYATKAMIMQTNMRNYNTAVATGKLDQSVMQEQITANTPLITAMRELGGEKEAGLVGDVAELSKKYKAPIDSFILTDSRPRLDPKTGQQETDPKTGRLLFNGVWSLMDSNARPNLDAATMQYCFDNNVTGSYRIDPDGNKVHINLPEDTRTRFIVANDMLSQAHSMQAATHTLLDSFSQLSKDGDKYGDQLKENLKDSHNATPSARAALSRYAGMALTPVDPTKPGSPTVMDATMIKDKVPSDDRAYVNSLIPQGAVEQAKVDSEKAAADQKTLAAVNTKVAERNAAPTLAQAGAILHDPNTTPEQKAQAQGMLNADTAHKANVAAAEAQIGIKTAGAKAEASEKGHIQGRLDMGLSAEPGKGTMGGVGTDSMTHPELASIVQDDKNYNTPDGTNQAFLQGMMKIDPQRARTLMAYSQGMDRQSFYATAKAYGGGFNADLHSYDPWYSVSNMDKFFAAQKSLGLGGAQSSTNTAFNAMLQHLDEAHTHYGLGAITGTSGKYDADIKNASTEMSGFYVGGKKPGENEIKGKLETYKSTFPGKASGALVEDAKDAMFKQVANYDAMNSSMPSAVKRPYFMSQAAAEAFTHLTGDQVDDRLVYHPPQGSTPILNNVNAVVGYDTPNGRVDAFGVGAHHFGQNGSQGSANNSSSSSSHPQAQSPVLSGSGAFMWNGSAWVDNPNKPK
jgi:hypothetical protein